MKLLLRSRAQSVTKVRRAGSRDICHFERYDQEVIRSGQPDDETSRRRRDCAWRDDHRRKVKVLVKTVIAFIRTETATTSIYSHHKKEQATSPSTANGRRHQKSHENHADVEDEGRVKENEERPSRDQWRQGACCSPVRKPSSTSDCSQCIRHFPFIQLLRAVYSVTLASAACALCFQNSTCAVRSAI